MPKRPDISAAFKRTFDEPGEQRTATVHPLTHILKDENAARVLMVQVALIEPDPNQPRKHFDAEALAELTESIREKGILQPILLRRHPDDRERCIIIAGERRWRASQAAGLKEIPALLRTENDAREVSLIENLQRENLNPIEEAEALLALKQERQYTDEQLAKIVGKSRSSITESLSLTKLPEAIKSECRTSDNWQKSQLLQVLRAGEPEKVAAVWDGVKSGEAVTVRALREKTATPAVKQGRPPHYRFEHKPKGQSFSVTVTFAKSRATHEEVKAALKDALKHVS